MVVLVEASKSHRSANAVSAVRRAKGSKRGWREVRVKRAGRVKGGGEAGRNMRADAGGRVGSAERGCVAGNIPAYPRLKTEDALVACLRGDEFAEVNRGGV